MGLRVIHSILRHGRPYTDPPFPGFHVLAATARMVLHIPETTNLIRNSFHHFMAGHYSITFSCHNTVGIIIAPIGEFK